MAPPKRFWKQNLAIYLGENWRAVVSKCWMSEPTEDLGDTQKHPGAEVAFDILAARLASTLTRTLRLW